MTAAEPPAGSRWAFGPRLQATVALLSGAYRMSKRQVQALLDDLLGLSASTGMVCKSERADAEAVAAPVDGVYEHVRSVPVAGVDVVEVAPPYDHAEITAFLAGRVVLEALSGIAWRRRREAGAPDRPARDPSSPLLEGRG